MGSCVSSAVRASLNLASWNCQLGHGGRQVVRCEGLRVLYNICLCVFNAAW